MRKLLLVLPLLLAMSIQCSDPPEQQPVFAMDAELKASLEKLSKIVAASVQPHIMSLSKKELMSPSAFTSTFDVARAALKNEQQQQVFDYIFEHPEMQKFVNWSQRFSSGVPLAENGRTEDIWDANSVTSTAAKAKIEELRYEVEGVIESLDGLGEQTVTNNVLVSLAAWQSDVNASTTLTSDDKTALGSVATMLYDQIPNLVHDYIYTYDIPPDQAKVQWSWKKFKVVFGSIVLVTALCVLAAVAVATIIVATTGAVGLAAPATIMIGAWEVSFTAMSVYIGTTAGLIAGSGMAASDKCLSSQTNNGFSFVVDTCQA